MRIAYLTGEYPRATDTFVQREVAVLRELGVDVRTFAIRRPALQENVGPEQQAERQGTIYILPCYPFALLAAHLRALSLSPVRYFGAFRLAMKTRPAGWHTLLYQLFYFAEAAVLADKVRRLDIKHVHNHFANSSCSVAMIAAHMGNFTYSLTMHGPAIFFEPKYWRIDEKIRRALFVSCISHFCRSQAMIFAPTSKWDRLHIVHCGVDPQLYKPVTHRGPGRQLLYVGRLAAVKGLPVLLKSLAAIRTHRPDVQLTVVGDGPDRAQLERCATHHGLKDHVRFVGYCSQSQVADFLQETDVFVMSSFAEGVPVVLMEAMAAGVPVVATRIAGVGELVEDGVSGFTVPPGDDVSLADKIEALLADEQLRERFGRAGRQHVEAQFDIRKEAAWLLRVMTSALRGSAEPIRPITAAGPPSGGADGRETLVTAARDLP